MTHPPIDLRSDTVTRPTPAMREVMARAEVGDDVYGEDPTVNRLQERVAALLGKEAAMFVPSGTMSNQIGVKVHTQPGDEMLCETSCHIYTWEAGGPAVLSGVTCRPIDGDYCALDVAQLENKIRPSNDHYVRTRLVCLENTLNRGGGAVYPIDKVRAISQWARSNGLAVHLDGARLWNASVASGVSPSEWASHFDTVSVCFSKGLGAPIGSALVGPTHLIQKAKRVRKLLGGGMRQAGVIAAAALFAVENHIARLADDHRNAQVIADAIRATPGLRLERDNVESNLVWFEVDPEFGTAKEVVDAIRAEGVLMSALGPYTIRACTHLDVTAAQAEESAATIRRVVGARVPVGA